MQVGIRGQIASLTLEKLSSSRASEGKFWLNTSSSSKIDYCKWIPFRSWSWELIWLILVCVVGLVLFFGLGVWLVGFWLFFLNPASWEYCLFIWLSENWFPDFWRSKLLEPTSFLVSCYSHIKTSSTGVPAALTGMVWAVFATELWSSLLALFLPAQGRYLFIISFTFF